MKEGERKVPYINRVQEVGSVLRSPKVDLEDREITMKVLWELPSSYKDVVTTLDALSGSSATFTMVLIERQLLQEERRQNQEQKDVKKEAASINSSSQNMERRFSSPLYCISSRRRVHREYRC